MDSAAIFEEYTQTVCGHVRERSVQPSIRAELQSHLEEKAEILENTGLSDQDAALQAVREMGPADEVGDRLAQAYRPASLTRYGAVVFLYTLLGLSASFLVSRWVGGGAASLLPQPSAFLPGQLAVHAAVSLGAILAAWAFACFLNYGLLLQRAFGAALLAFFLALSAAFLSFLPGSTSVSIAHWLFPFGYFSLCLLSAYVKKGRWSLPLLWGGGFLLCSGYAVFNQHKGALLLFLLTLCLVSLLAFSKGKAVFSRKGLAALTLPALALCAALLFGSAADRSAPGAACTGYWSPDYSSSLCQELVSHAKPLGLAEFSAAEYHRLIGQRYDMDSFQKLFALQESSPLAQSYRAERDRLLRAPASNHLNNLMPENFQQEYLFLYIALRYGFVYAGILMVSMGLLLIFLLTQASACHRLRGLSSVSISAVLPGKPGPWFQFEHRTPLRQLGARFAGCQLL